MFAKKKETFNRLHFKNHKHRECANFIILYIKVVFQFLSMMLQLYIDLCLDTLQKQRVVGSSGTFLRTKVAKISSVTREDLNGCIPQEKIS